MPDDPRPAGVGIVPHTHWDREWHAPFQTFRLRLVGLLDILLDLLQHDDSYARFLLDGQTAVIDDYLEMRPGAEAVIRALVTDGRLTIGPWMILMDEFMVSGETIVRDLQMGMRRAAELGGAMPVGYLPDMFGHVAQMPQILRAAGIDHAVVWRGVPAAINRSAFWWIAPDGSRVRAEYLYGSYSNGRDLPDDPNSLLARARGYELELGDVRLPGGDLLLMNGSDHLLPQPGLGAVVAAANDAQTDVHFEVTSLPEYLARQPVDGLPSWSGELRSGARADLLMGVASNRVDVHQAAARAERAIERVAEPLAALFLPPSEHPDAFFALAWKSLVLNSAHDSSCACSADEVVDQVLVRYHEARQIGEGLAGQALDALAADITAAPGALVVVNPSQAARGGLVTCTVPGAGPARVQRADGTVIASQVVARRTRDVFTATVTGRKVGWVLDLIRGPEVTGTRITRVERTRHGDGTEELHFIGTSDARAAIDLEDTREELRLLGEAGATVKIRVSRPQEHDIAFVADPVPGFGWVTYRVLDTQPTSTPEATPVGSGTVVTTEHSLENGLIRVEVDPDGIGFSVEADGVRVDGLGRLVDGGDGGDTYSYSPPTDDVVIDRPVASRFGARERGPVRGQLYLDRTYRWPVAAIGDERSCARRSDDAADVTVRTTLEVRAGERFVRIHTEFDNPCRDHRLRAHFPLPARVNGSDAECAFAVVHRGLDAEGGPHEAPLPTFVSRRFVDASDGAVGLALLHDGLLEYEIVGGGRELALTLLRATGYLSRAEPSLRPDPAGPLEPLVGPQLLGPIGCDYAVMPHRGDWSAAALHALADEFLVPLASTAATGSPGSRADSGQALEVSGGVVSALHRADGALTLRAFNPAPVAAQLRIWRDGLPARGQVVDLLDRPVADFSGSAELRAGAIITLRPG